MLFSRNWLADWVELPETIQELRDRLTFAGLAVEQVDKVGDDLVLDIDITTNRPDCMCHRGVAREVAVLTGRPLVEPSRPAPKVAAERAESTLSVRVEEGGDCPRYAAKVLRGVRVGPSPEWLRRRLETLGLRSINNVVDVTNYILWETGQPLHAFDLDTLEGGEIRVRRAAPGEILTTLDGEERKLDPEVLVIADAKVPVALAGIMGGLDTEVTETTTRIALESAHFDRRRVRIGARKLAMHTDASHRFERGADPGACLWAAERAAALIVELAGGEVLDGALDEAAPVAAWPPKGRLEQGRLDAFAGVEISPRDTEAWLRGLGFELEALGEGVWEVTVPSWRYYDMQPRADGGVYEADLFEEVMRIHGFDGIPSTLPRLAGPDAPRSAQQHRRDLVRGHLVAAGYAEAVSFAFHSREMDASLPSVEPGSSPLELANPLSERYSLLRRSLVPNLLEGARFNRRRGVASVRQFEIGHLFFDALEGRRECEALGLICGGTLGLPWSRQIELDFFDLKGVLESLGEALGVTLEMRPAAELMGLVEGAAAGIWVEGEDNPRGWMGRLEESDAEAPLFAAEILLDGLGGDALGSTARLRKIAVPSRFPGIVADLTLTHALEVPWSDLRSAVTAHRPDNLVDFGLKDRYQGTGVPEGAVNSTLYFLYQAPDRSLTQEEVNQRQGALSAELESRFGWKG